MTAPVDEREHAAARVDLKGLWRPALLFAASRGLVALAFVVASASHRRLSFHKASSDWDGGFFFHIANHGYPNQVPAHGASLLVFFPGYPLAIRGVRNLFGMEAYGASTIVVLTFGLAAACAIWLLTRELADAEAADRAVALFVFAPGSFVLSMAYSEALFVFCAVAACWALIRQRWILAGVFGMFGTLTRAEGLAIVLAAACAAYFAIRKRHDLRSLLAVALSASGFIGVQLYFWAHTGDLSAYFDAERRGWHQGPPTLGTGRYDDVQSLVHTISIGARPDWNHVVPLAGFVVFVGAFVLLVKWRPPPELIAFTLGMGIFAFTTTQVGFRPRLVMSAFPLSMALGVKLRRGPWFAIALGTSATLLIMLAIVTVTTTYITP